MKRLGTALLYAIVAYVVAALAGYLLVQQFSSNVHDRALEAAMTGAIVVGPPRAVVAAPRAGAVDAVPERAPAVVERLGAGRHLV